MYNQADKREQTNQLSTDSGQERLDKLEEAVQQVSEQMAIIGRQVRGNPRFPSNSRQRDVECYQCGRRGCIAQNCWHHKNYQDMLSTRCSPSAVNARPVKLIPALSRDIRFKAAYTSGTMNDQTLHLLLDSDAFYSVITCHYNKCNLLHLSMNADRSSVFPNGTANIWVVWK